MNISHTFSVDCIEVKDRGFDDSLTLFRFADHLAVAVGNSFVRITSNQLAQNLDTLTLQLISAGLFAPEAEFTAHVLSELPSYLSPQKTVAFETNSKHNQ